MRFHALLSSLVAFITAVRGSVIFDQNIATPTSDRQGMYVSQSAHGDLVVIGTPTNPQVSGSSFRNQTQLSAAAYARGEYYLPTWNQTAGVWAVSVQNITNQLPDNESFVPDQIFDIQYLTTWMTIRNKTLSYFNATHLDSVRGFFNQKPNGAWITTELSCAKGKATAIAMAAVLTGNGSPCTNLSTNQTAIPALTTVFRQDIMSVGLNIANVIDEISGDGEANDFYWSALKAMICLQGAWKGSSHFQDSSTK